MSTLLASLRRSRAAFRAWDALGTVLFNLFAAVLLSLFLLPLGYMVMTSLKENAQFIAQDPPALPARWATWTYQGKTYPLYYVPLEDGTKQLALIKPGLRKSEFMDPQSPSSGIITVNQFRYSLQPVFYPYYTMENYWPLIQDPYFQQAFLNTLKITFLGVSVSVISSILVAYGFSRFRIPFRGLLFLCLIGTIMLPEKVTFIPTYAMFSVILNWDNTYLPLILPHAFGNAMMIFLLYQNFRRIPKEQEEAAIIDGARPVHILLHIIIPQSLPVIVTVILFQFFYFWSDLRAPSTYLSMAPDLWPISSWVQQGGSFYGVAGITPNVLQVRSLVSMIVPVLVLFLSQRFFMRGVEITNVEK